MTDIVVVEESGTIVVTIAEQGPAGAGAPPATAVVSETDYGQSPVVGIDDIFAREDHSHGTPASNDLNPDFVKYNTVAIEAVPTDQAVTSWSQADRALQDSLGNDVFYQHGQELYILVHNQTGDTLPNGTSLMYGGSVGASGNMLVVPFVADGSFPAELFIGFATEDIPNGATLGLVTWFGRVRGFNTTHLTAGLIAYGDPADPGVITNTKPEAPFLKASLALVMSSKNDGEILVRPHFGTTLADLHDAQIASPQDGQFIRWINANGRWENKTVTYQDSIVLHTFDPDPKRNSEINIHGGLSPIATGDTLSTGVDITGTNGISRLYFAVIAGADVTGSFTVTGTIVDRDTGVETADSEVITVDAVTIDNQTTDANGNIVHDLTGGYMTTNWFAGAYTVSTTDLILSDVDTYQAAFYQFADHPVVTINTFDPTVVIKNASANFSGHLYSVTNQIGSKYDIQTIADAEVTTPAVTREYRLRRSNLAISMDGTTDGIFVDVFFNSTGVDFENFDLTIEAEVTKTL